MKKFLLFFIAAATIPFFGNAQCTTNNATDCECLDSSEMDCDLLPDVTVSWSTGYYSHTEYPPGEGLQEGELNYAENWFGITPEIEEMGRIRVSGKTPNIGVGPLNIRGADNDGYRWMICYDSGVADTFQIYDPDWNDDTYCPDGSNPKHISWQRIFHKNADGSMGFWEKMIGTMEYHPTHGHMHFDEWVAMTLRIPDANNMDNPLDWEIVGEGAKIGFCVMDLGSCSGGGCMDDETVFDQGTELFQSDFPNYGLGGGSYGCSPVSQGISSGYTDTYGEYLDGMFINIPLGTCNGDYAVVLVVENELLVESNTENNHAWFPITLTQQSSSVPVLTVSSSSEFLCNGGVVELNANTDNDAVLLWDDGSSASTITISEPGNYTVVASGGNYDCDAVQSINIPVIGIEDIEICQGEFTELIASSENAVWYDSTGVTIVGEGLSFTTPVLYESARYYVSPYVVGDNYEVGPLQHEGENEYSSSGTVGYIEFDALGGFTLNSVDLYTDEAGDRTILLLDNNGDVVEEHTEFIPVSETAPYVVTLDFNIPSGNNYRLTTDGDQHLKRTDGDDATLNYPYLIDGVVSLNDSPYGTDWYYYFYNWKISNSYECDLISADVIVKDCSSIHSTQLNSFNVYPNPTNGLFNLSLELESSSLIDLKVLSILGELVYSQKETTKSLSQQIDLRSFSKGIYTLNIVVDGETYIQKIVLQ